MIFAFVASSVELDKRTNASDSYARLVWFAMETKGEPTTRCLIEQKVMECLQMFNYAYGEDFMCKSHTRLLEGSKDFTEGREEDYKRPGRSATSLDEKSG
ncbi:hypothetical protein NPIL_71691 [Nephila pilipes]|uniref:Uncharacterized protein n=1 Tax=Nephila pilipes TaxID=299642 RepID=A0A8X6NMQ4_NEPPI|nr:hypothetical protein NPIL_71691 [Nephila pilipes]